MVVKGERKTMRTKWREEKERMKGMTRRQKLDHLWTYYKEFLWIASVVLLLVIATITSLINVIFRERVVTGIMVNISIEQRAMNYLGEEFHDKLGARDYWDKVNIEYTSFDPVEEIAGDEMSYYASMTIINEVSAETLDYMILDKIAMEYYIQREVYMDLREFFSAEELAKLEAEERLIYAREEEAEEAWVVAVDITDIPFIKDNLTGEFQVYFALAGNTERIEECHKVWQHMQDWKTP